MRLTRILLPLLMCAVSACSNRHVVQVVDASGHPISGAQIKYQSPSIEGASAQTDAEGEATPPDLAGAKWIRVSKPGFETATVNVPATWPLKLTLQKMPEIAAPSAVSISSVGTPAALSGGKSMLPRSHISRQTIQEMFDNMRRQTRWNLDGDMLWGYFFFDPSQRKLEVASKELEKQGYQFVELFEAEDKGRKTGVFVLHVQKIETHSVDSLDQRNAELDAFAAKYQLQSYDGMDVGPVAPPAPPTQTRPAP